MSDKTAQEPMTHQRLPKEAYISPDWLAREQRALFERQWVFACLSSDLSSRGDYLTLRVGALSLIILRDGQGRLRAFHNLCRHRGTELLEGHGRLGQSIICPYHKWAYGFDGRLIGVPQEALCFAELDKQHFSLHPAALAEYKGLVFIHPEPDIAANFADWLGGLQAVPWPHRVEDLCEGPTLVYEMNCNWKIFYENAIDGYHLVHLHKNTLGGPEPGANCWERHGAHLVWYSTENPGRKTCSPKKVAEAMAGRAAIRGCEKGDYPGVAMLYPATIVTASPFDFSISRLQTAGPDRCRLTVRTWKAAKGEKASGEPERRVIRLADLDGHPLESGDFMMEDLWICEKIQRSLHSSRFAVGPLAAGAGAESPLLWFQDQLLSDLEKAS